MVFKAKAISVLQNNAELGDANCMGRKMGGCLGFVTIGNGMFVLVSKL